MSVRLVNIVSAQAPFVLFQSGVVVAGPHFVAELELFVSGLVNGQVI